MLVFAAARQADFCRLLQAFAGRRCRRLHGQTFDSTDKPHLARVRVHDPLVAHAAGPAQHDLLHVLPQHLEAHCRQVLLADLVEELDAGPQQLLRDALARAVDADLDARRRPHHRRREHRHRDRLPEAPRRADQHLLREVLPAVALQHLVVVARKLPSGLVLPEAARARFLRVSGRVWSVYKILVRIRI